MAVSVGAQLVRYGAPILILPILIRDLSTTEFARYAVAMAGGMAVGQFTEFGFGLSAVRELANRSAAPRAAAIACGEVLVGKTLMFFVTCCVYAAVRASASTITSFADMALPLLVGAAYGFTPNWFYIGVGKAHVLALAELLTSALQLLLIVSLVNEGDPYEGAVLATLAPVAALALYGNLQGVCTLSFRLPSVATVWRATQTASHFFVATNGPSLTNRALLITLGITAAPVQVAAYAAGERIASAAVGTLAPVMRVLIPRVVFLQAKDPARGGDLVRRATWIGTLTYAGASLALASTSSYWVTWVFGPTLAGLEPVIACLLLIVPLAAFSRILGLLVLVPAARERQLHYLTLAVCGAGIAASFAIAAHEALPVAGLRLAVEAAIAAGCAVLVRRFRCQQVPPSADGVRIHEQD